MNILLDVGLPLALAFIMFSLGLGLTRADFARVASMPRAVATGAAAQLLVLPITAFLLLQVFPLPPELAVGVMILSFAPGGVTSNILTKFAGGAVALSVTLTALISLLAVITIPLLTAAAVSHFMGADAPEVDVTALAISMALITLVPTLLGVLVRAVAPGPAVRFEPWASKAAALLFAIIILAALAANWTVFSQNIATLAPLLITLNLGLLALGFALARLLRLPRPEATAIALESGIQNGTLGIATGALIVESAAALPAFSLPSGVYGITMYLVTLPVIAVLRWQNSRAARL